MVRVLFVVFFSRTRPVIKILFLVCFVCFFCFPFLSFSRKRLTSFSFYSIVRFYFPRKLLVPLLSFISLVCVSLSLVLSLIKRRFEIKMWLWISGPFSHWFWVFILPERKAGIGLDGSAGRISVPMRSTNQSDRTASYSWDASLLLLVRTEGRPFWSVDWLFFIVSFLNQKRIKLDALPWCQSICNDSLKRFRF